jgi:hypothetical protein
VAVLAGSLASQSTYTTQWARNPAQAYVTKLDADLKRLGPDVALYNTPANSTILPIIEPNHSISTLAGLLKRPARFDTDGALQVVRSDGSIGPAGLFTVAHPINPSSARCVSILRGVGDWTIPLSSTEHTGEYFLRMSYLQQAASVITVRLGTKARRLIEPVDGARVQLPELLGAVTLRLPLTIPTSLVIHSDSLATNLCLGDVSIGVPLPKARR